MTEEIKDAAPAPEETAEAETVDWQAKYEEMRGHMRDWEKKAKANQSAADELEQLKAAQMSEQEKANARADKAEAELEALKAEAAKVDAARAIANETNVPFDLLMYCKDADAMTEFAKKFQAEQPIVHSAGSAQKSRIQREGNLSNGDIFAAAVQDLF